MSQDFAVCQDCGMLIVMESGFAHACAPKRNLDFTLAVLEERLKVEAEEKSKLLLQVGELQKQLADKEQQRLGAHKAWMDLNNEEQKTAQENRDLKATIEGMEAAYETLMEDDTELQEAKRLNGELKEELRKSNKERLAWEASAHKYSDRIVVAYAGLVLHQHEYPWIPEILAKLRPSKCEHRNIEAVGEGFRRCKDCGENEPDYFIEKPIQPQQKQCTVVSAEGHKCSSYQGHDGPHVLALKRVEGA